MSAYEGMRRRLRRHPLLSDALLAAAIVALRLVLLPVSPPRYQPHDLRTALAWTVLGVLPIVLRRRWWWPSVALAVALTVAALGDVDYAQTQSYALIVLTYTAANRLAVRSAVLASLLLWPPQMLVSCRVTHPDRANTILLLVIDALLALVCFFLGRFNRTRHAYTGALEARTREAETNQRALAGQAVADERRRIARELHDVVAHHVSVMGVLATGARRSLRHDPDAAADALLSIEQTGRTTLRELQRLLNVLRPDDGTGDDEAAGLAPQPGLTAVRALIEQTRRTGLPVAVRIDGEPYPVDAGVGLAVYRLIQEALTNAVKHAGPVARAHVRIDFGSAALTVEVFDTGRGPDPQRDDRGATGHGLPGMRERVALYGGDLRTGPRPGGGFRVYARIPMDNLEGLSRLPAGTGDPRG
ncbi:MAG: sensor histidine kinase [Actinocatenispora sp.]